MSFKLRKIVGSSLCLGCGLCEALARRDGVRMRLAENGFYEPVSQNRIAKATQTELKKLCPGIRLDCIDTRETFCGPVKAAYEGWACDPHIRRTGSSGGVVTALALHLLRTKQATGVLQVGTRDGHYLYNGLKLSRTEEEVRACASSRYAPALMFDRIDELLSGSEERYLFIGKPCDVMALREYTKLHPEHKSRIEYWVSLVCAGMPSYNATRKLIARAADPTPVVSLRYRGDGWPGDFKVSFEDGKIFRCSYNESWGQVLGRDVRFRCKICPDGIGQYADLVVGDAWHTKDGYPDFTEQEGRSFLLARNARGAELAEKARDAGILSLSPLDIRGLEQMQPYQYQRLRNAFYKLAPAWIVTGGLLISDFRVSRQEKVSEPPWVLSIAITEDSNHVFFLYRCLKNRHARRILLRIIARSGGGLAFSSEVRKLYAETHRIRIGYGTYGGCFDTENIPPDVSFGNYCSIASGVRIFRANHPSGRFTTHPILYNPVMGYVAKDMLERPPLEIGHDVWIGANAIILPGVSRIGNGAVIGAGSVVTKDVGPYEIVAGNPARAIRMRFDERQIAALESSRW